MTWIAKIFNADPIYRAKTLTQKGEYTVVFTYNTLTLITNRTYTSREPEYIPNLNINHNMNINREHTELWELHTNRKRTWNTQPHLRTTILIKKLLCINL